MSLSAESIGARRSGISKADSLTQLPRKTPHHFDMRAPAELIHHIHPIKPKARILQGLSLSGKGLGVAGHMHHAGDITGHNLSDLRLRSGSGRIKNHRIKPLEF